MTEKPNLSYIDKLSGNDQAFKEKFIGIIKMEFPQEQEHFSVLFNKKSYSEAAEVVHKLKHKINIFGLNSDYQYASLFEEALLNGETQYFSEFIATLERIEAYLKTL